MNRSGVETRITRLPSGQLLLVSWLEDETFFSLCARHHVLSGNGFAPITSRELFGQKQWKRPTHDFSIDFNIFSQNANGKLGTTDEIIRLRTAVPIYSRFLDHEVRGKLLDDLKRGNYRGIHAKLGMLGSKSPLTHILRACDKCMEYDESESHVAYWHRAHQLPGTYRCLKHRIPLTEIVKDKIFETTCGWPLPREIQEKGWLETKIPQISPRHEEMLLSLAAISSSLISTSATLELNPKALRQIYTFSIMRRGLITEQRGVDYDEVLSSLVTYAGPAIQAANLGHNTLKGALRCMVNLRETPYVITQPLYHILIIGWLFDNWESFEATYHAWITHDFDALSKTFEFYESGSNRPQLSDSIRNRLLNYIRSENCALVEGAERAGVKYVLALFWAIKGDYRGDKGLPRYVQDIIADLCSIGASMTEIAALLGLTFGVVEYFIQERPGLYRRWANATHGRHRPFALAPEPIVCQPDDNDDGDEPHRAR